MYGQRMSPNQEKDKETHFFWENPTFSGDKLSDIRNLLQADVIIIQKVYILSEKPCTFSEKFAFHDKPTHVSWQLEWVFSKVGSSEKRLFAVLICWIGYIKSSYRAGVYVIKGVTAETREHPQTTCRF